MTAKPKIGLLDDWRRVLRRAWSIRFSLLALAALGVTPAGFGWIKGASHVRAQWDAAIQQQTLQATVKVVTEYVDRVRVVRVVRVVREKGDTIIKEVPVHGPYKPMLLALSTVALCACTTLPPPGELPEPARNADAAAAGIALSAVAGTVAANYQTCHENAEQLRALQEWVGEMGATKQIPSPTP